jgi:hypothetical protein
MSDQLDPCGERCQFDNVNDAPPFGTGGRCNRALPGGQLATNSLPRSSCFAYALLVSPPHKSSTIPQGDMSAHPAPQPVGVAEGTAGGINGKASTNPAVPSKLMQ